MVLAPQAICTEVGPPEKTRQTVRKGLNDGLGETPLGAQLNYIEKRTATLPIQFVQVLTNFW
jgi:hypothetical protein